MTIARSETRLSIADLDRRLGISRQAAHTVVHAVCREGLVELNANPADRRILQARLTPAGERAFATAEAGEAAWVIVLLNGLDTGQIVATTHILNVIRRRLERAAQQEAEEREQIRRAAGSPHRPDARSGPGCAGAKTCIVSAGRPSNPAHPNKGERTHVR